MNKIISDGQTELSKTLGIDRENLQFVGMQSLTPSKYAYFPLFNIVDKNSKHYMSTRAAHVFYKRDKATNTYIQLNSWYEAMEY